MKGKRTLCRAVVCDWKQVIPHPAQRHAGAAQGEGSAPARGAAKFPHDVQQLLLPPLDATFTRFVRSAVVSQVRAEKAPQNWAPSWGCGRMSRPELERADGAACGDGGRPASCARAWHGGFHRPHRPAIARRTVGVDSGGKRAPGADGCVHGAGQCLILAGLAGGDSGWSGSCECAHGDTILPRAGGRALPRRALVPAKSGLLKAVAEICGLRFRPARPAAGNFHRGIQTRATAHLFDEGFVERAQAGITHAHRGLGHIGFAGLE